MRVVMNQISALGVRTGVGQYTHQLLRCLREQATGDAIEGFPEGWWFPCTRRAWAGVRTVLEPPKASGPSSRGAAVAYLRHCGQRLIARRFRSFCTRRKTHLYHEPNFIPLAADVPTLATFHDLSALLHPEWHPADRAAHFERHLPGAAARCAHILTVSEFGRREVVHTLGVAPERVTRVYNGIRPDLGPLPEPLVAGTLRRLGLPPRYLLCLGTIEPRKNVLLLMRAYCALPPHLRARWPLVLVGGWGWRVETVAEYLHQVGRHRGVIHVGYLKDEELAAVYNGARALLYPSLYEGFGLPPLEMLACGGAVITSTAAALVEIVGSKAHLVHAENLDGWVDALQRVLTDDDWWQSLRAGARAVAQPFTWDRCAAETLRVYRSVAGLRAAEPTSRAAA
jgi:alpha-1,3-rhamnosyl/mannosyltransferase